MGITLGCLCDENLGHQYELAMGRVQGIVEKQCCRVRRRGGGGRRCVHTFSTQGMRRVCGIHPMGDMVHSTGGCRRDTGTTRRQRGRRSSPKAH